MYIWGAAGTGKSYLMRHLRDWCLANNTSVLWTSANEAGPTEEAWAARLSAFVGSPGGEPSSLDAATRALEDHCHGRHFTWIIDDIDTLNTTRNAIMQTAIRIIRHGGRVILAGRTSPLQLWPGQTYVRSFIDAIELPDLASMDAEAILKSRGLSDPTVIQQAIAVAHGRPQILSAIADGLAVLNETAVPSAQWAFMANPVDLSGYLIEQICHPGSRRLMWRAGNPQDGLDTLVAAASLTPMFNREWLLRVAGRALVSELWETFTALPLLHTYRGGYYGIFPRLRQQVVHTVKKVRPWMWEHWMRAATTYYMSQLRAGSIPKEHAWSLLAPYIRPHLGETPLSDGEGLVAIRHEPIAAAQPGAVSVSWGDGSPGASVAFEEPTPGHLRLYDMTRDPEDPSLGPLLVATVGRDFYRYQTITWDGLANQPAFQDLLDLLHFEGAAPCRILDFTTRDYLTWLQELIAPPSAPLPDNPVAVVQSVLHALREGTDDFGPGINDYWTHISRNTAPFRTWFLDALNSADLGERIDGKTVLVLYYLDRRGTHEKLSELLHVSRATYFRNHRAALERLAETVFDYPRSS